jgi:hypothetical protein
MLISDVLRTKGHNGVRIRTADSVTNAEDRWMKPVGIFLVRDFINAIARHGATVPPGPRGCQFVAFRYSTIGPEVAV